MSPRWIEYKNIDEIVPAIVNPKLHDWDALDASMSVHSYTEPVLEDGRTGRLVSGHGRVESLQKRRDRGEEAPEGIEVQDGVWRIPVVMGWASKDDAHATSVLLGANQITMSEGWRQDEVAALVQALEEVDPVLLLSAGFDQEAISDAIAAADDDRLLETSGDDDWEQVTLRLPPDVALMFRAALDAMGGPESEAVRRLCEAATGDAPPF